MPGEGAGGGDEREERERETRCAGRQRSTIGEARRDLEAVDVLEPTRVFSETLCVTQFVTHIRVTTGGTLWVRPSAALWSRDHVRVTLRD